MSVCGFKTCLTVVLQDMFDGFGLRLSSRWLGAIAARVGLEDGDVVIGSSWVGAYLVAVHEDAKDGVLDGDRPLAPGCYVRALALTGDGDCAVGRHASHGPVRGAGGGNGPEEGHAPRCAAR